VQKQKEEPEITPVSKKNSRKASPRKQSPKKAIVIEPRSSDESSEEVDRYPEGADLPHEFQDLYESFV
jgi:hypothetical protein